MNYACIACIGIDSVMKIEKTNYPQVYLEECKYKVKKKKNAWIYRCYLRSCSDSEW